MNVLDTLNFVTFNPLQNNNPIPFRCRKLIVKMDEQIHRSAKKTPHPRKTNGLLTKKISKPKLKLSVGGLQAWMAGLT